MVEPQQVAEHVRAAAVAVLHLPQFLGLLVHDGLDAAGDVDEGALRGVAQVLLGDDGVEHRAQHGLVRRPELQCQAGPMGLGFLQGGEHLLGELPLAQPLHDVGQQLLRQPYGLGLLPVQGSLVRGDRQPQRGHRFAAPGGLTAGEGHGHEGHGADPGDGGAGRCGHLRHGDRRSGGGQQGGQRPCDG